MQAAGWIRSRPCSARGIEANTGEATAAGYTEEKVS
jgi:hypothetical protein